MVALYQINKKQKLNEFNLYDIIAYKHDLLNGQVKSI